ncbi:hypothetical protein [Blastomonas sp.]|uniref:hypothetical protein n=1 Tax=Blastomonas sp. TaxID=1909299 RepID=UPI0035932C51
MNHDNDPKDPIGCAEESAQRAGQKQSSLNDSADRTTAPDPEHTETSEADLDEALEDSMDGSDPPSALQP